LEASETLASIASPSISSSGPLTAIDRACEGDRRWFEAHPGQAQRLRRPMAGEFHPFEGQTAQPPLVLVLQIRPGLRVRAGAPLLRFDAGEEAP
jgi:hypothetical protein